MSAQLLQLACQEVRELVQMGRRQVAESVLQRIPILNADEESIVELIYTEFDARLQRGEDFCLDEFSKRFPDHRDRLERLFRIHEAFALDAHDDCDAPPTSDVSKIISRETQSVAEFNADTRRGRQASSTPEADTEAVTQHAQSALMGRQRGDYTVLREVDRGGMGIVHQARDERLGRLVAIKTLRFPWSDGDHRERLLREASAAAKLHHPNVVQVYEVGDAEDGPYCVMEWLSGGTLEDVTKQRIFQPTEAAQLLIQLSGAVEYAHQRGVVHRDLKPANILLDDHGRPKIADFGLAKVQHELNDDGLAASAPSMTRTGTIIGTPSYMPPEQVLGQLDRVGPLADVYSLGAVLYEMLTSRPPFRGTSTVETLGMVVSADVVPPSRFNDALPRDLQTICLKCLAKAPEDRYASAADLRDDLQRFVDGVPTLARPMPAPLRAARWCRRNPSVATLLTAFVTSLVLGVAGMSWQWQNARTQALVAEAERHEAQLERVAAIREREHALEQQQRAEQNFSVAHQMVERLVNLGAQFTRDPETARAGRRLLEETLDFYAGVLRLDSEDPGIRFATSNAYLRVGQIQNELGRWSEARTALNRAAEIYTSLRDEFPDNPEYGFWLVESHFQRGYAFRGSREIREAAEAFGQAVHVGEELVARYPDVLKYKSLLSISLINWRTCVSRNTPEAEQALRRAVAIQEEVVRADPQGVWPLQDLAQGKDNLAHEERRLGNLDAAERLMHQAIEVRQRVQAIQPTDPMHQFYLARGYHHLAQLCDAQQRYDDAEKYHQLAINEVTTLCEQKKQALNFRKLQIDCELARMRHYHQADNVEAWVNCFESVMCYYHAVMAEWPEDPSHATAALRQLDLALDWCQQLDEEAVVARVQQVARQTVAKVRENDRQLSSSEETRGNDTATEQSILLNRRLAHAAHRVGDLPTAVRALSKSVTADAARLLQSTSLRLPKMVGAPAPEHGNP